MGDVKESSAFLTLNEVALREGYRRPVTVEELESLVCARCKAPMQVRAFWLERESPTSMVCQPECLGCGGLGSVLFRNKHEALRFAFKNKWAVLP